MSHRHCQTSAEEPPEFRGHLDLPQRRGEGEETRGWSDLPGDAAGGRAVTGALGEADALRTAGDAEGVGVVASRGQGEARGEGEEAGLGLGAGPRLRPAPGAQLRRDVAETLSLEETILCKGGTWWLRSVVGLSCFADARGEGQVPVFHSIIIEGSRSAIRLRAPDIEFYETFNVFQLG
jgi:hypothetical protein